MTQYAQTPVKHVAPGRRPPSCRRDLEKLDGRWRLVFTNNLVGLGKLSPLALKDVYQVKRGREGGRQNSHVRVCVWCRSSLIYRRDVAAIQAPGTCFSFFWRSQRNFHSKQHGLLNGHRDQQDGAGCPPPHDPSRLLPAVWWCRCCFHRFRWWTTLPAS